MGRRFENLIAIMIDSEWIAVDSAEGALKLLEGHWPSVDGPSYLRAAKSCRAFIDGVGSEVAAKATFAVAAMEAGLSFRLYDDYLEFAAAQVASAVEQDVKQSRASIVATEAAE